MKRRDFVLASAGLALSAPAVWAMGPPSDDTPDNRHEDSVSFGRFRIEAGGRRYQVKQIVFQANTAYRLDFRRSVPVYMLQSGFSDLDAMLNSRRTPFNGRFAGAMPVGDIRLLGDTLFVVAAPGRDARPERAVVVNRGSVYAHPGKFRAIGTSVAQRANASDALQLGSTVFGQAGNGDLLIAIGDGF